MKMSAFSLVIVLALALSLGGAGCAGGKEAVPTPTPEPTIPPHFKTYSHETGFVSISCPSDWQTEWRMRDLSWLEDPENLRDEALGFDLIKPSENTCIGGLVFYAGPLGDQDWGTGMFITVERLYEGAWTVDSALEAVTTQTKNAYPDYYELSRIKTTIAGRPVAIVDYEVSRPDSGTYRNLVMIAVNENTSWVVSCGTHIDKFADYEGTFYDIIGSFRILK